MNYPRSIPEPESHEPKEVYAFFGLTAYTSQVLEKSVLNLIVGAKLIKMNKLHPNTADELFNSSI